MASPALRYTETQAITYRKTWKGSVFSNFFNPILFLLAMGLGLGSLVDEGTGRSALEGFDYLAYLAPGLLAAAAMQTGAGEGSFPVMAGIKWTRTYHAALATPLSTADLIRGHLIWVTVRLAMVSVAFAFVAAAFGAMGPGRAAIAVGPAILTGLAHGALTTAFAAWVKSDMSLSLLFRFGIIPMFLFSGTFFPITQLPGWMQPLANVVPLWHGVELTRNLALGIEFSINPWIHVGYLVAWTVIGTVLATRLFTQKLLP